MLKLIKNEYGKIFFKKTTYIILAICLLFGFGLGFIVSYSSDSLNNYQYYNAITIDEYKNMYSNSDDLYDRLYYRQYSIYNELGYEMEQDIPVWISDAMHTIMFNHQIYVEFNSLNDKAAASDRYGITLDNIDLDHETDISSQMISAIKNLDYKLFYSLCADDADYYKAKDPLYVNYDYEYYKYILDNNINPFDEENRINTLKLFISSKTDYNNMAASKENGEMISEQKFFETERTYRLYQYVFDNNIENVLFEQSAYENMPLCNNKFIRTLTSGILMEGMAAIFIIIVAAGIFANEYSNGTIKFLLINPVKRAKIFWSKYITCTSLLVITLFVFFIMHFLFTIILCGTDGINGVYLSYGDGTVHEQSVILYALKQYALSGISVVTSATIAFTISAFLRSTALAITISLGIELAGSAISGFLYSFGHDWGRYLLFSNTDIAGIISGNTLFPAQTLTFAIVTITIYMAVMLLTAYDGFTRREV